MLDPLQLSPQTIARLQKHARPFVDTVDTVVNRLLDHFERGGAEETDADVVTDGNVRDFDPSSPPNLTHTKVLSITINGVKLARADTNWNALVNEAIRQARKKIKLESDLRRIIQANCVVGKKEDEGYRYLPEANLSVQGQDANSAWRTVFHISKLLHFSFEVTFVWRLKKEAQNPGVTGRFVMTKVRWI